VERKKLVAEAKDSLPTAFEQLVECYDAMAFRLAQTIAHSRADAEEMIQDAFVRAFKNLSRFRGDSGFYTWLVGITINEGLMKARRRRLEIRAGRIAETGTYSQQGIQSWA
jgi:RNA polymerase sigma-70 factor (ECF subfamily)